MRERGATVDATKQHVYTGGLPEHERKVNESGRCKDSCKYKAEETGRARTISQESPACTTLSQTQPHAQEFLSSDDGETGRAPEV